jgi:hypothetical protein
MQAGHIQLDGEVNQVVDAYLQSVSYNGHSLAPPAQ